MKTLLLSSLCALTAIASGCDGAPYATLQSQLEEFVADKDASIGIAVIIDGCDTIAVNGSEKFPMLSVYKFPQALAVADFCRAEGLEPDDSIDIAPAELLPDTWSPLRDKYAAAAELRLPLGELLDYSVTLSDNNACDILFRLIGGPAVADSLMKALGFADIDIRSTEDEMHRDMGLCFKNTSTPKAMAALFDRFYRLEMDHEGPVNERLGAVMKNCATGLGRLPAPLTDAGVTIGHKTGTGDMDSDGRIIAVNDAGYVFLPDGHSYAIAVFITGSAYTMAETESLIAAISEMVYSALAGSPL